MDYDAAGNMIRQDLLVGPSGAVARWDYTYDAWNRLVKVTVDPPGSTTAQLRATYGYNGLDWRTTRTADANSDNTIDQANLYYYDASWRLLEERIDDGYTAPSTPTDPPTGMTPTRVTQRVWGLEYIDDLLYVHTDGPVPGSGGESEEGGDEENGGEDGGTLDGDFKDAVAFYALTDRLYNVIAMARPDGTVVEKVRYTAYGVGTHTRFETAQLMGDANFDGLVDFVDLNKVLAAYGNLSSPTSNYDPECDFNNDGVVDFADLNRTLSAFSGSYALESEGSITMQTVGNTVSYCGYIIDPAVGMHLARHRWMDPSQGRWSRRDPLGSPGMTMSADRRSRTRGGSIVFVERARSTGSEYLDGMNRYLYVASGPVEYVDPFGLQANKGQGPWDSYKNGSPNFNPTEKKLWDELGLSAKLCMKAAYDKALAAVNDPKYAGSLHNGDGDAVRHCTWNCEMSRCLGSEGAKKWGDAHEETSDQPEESDMDLHNNQRGRDAWGGIWNDNKDRKDWIRTGDGLGRGMACVYIQPTDPRLDNKCKESCEKALSEGRLKVLDKNKWN